MIEQWIETLRRGECIKEHELKKLCNLVRECVGVIGRCACGWRLPFDLWDLVMMAAMVVIGALHLAHLTHP
jgi:hypothetical protein